MLLKSESAKVFPWSFARTEAKESIASARVTTSVSPSLIPSFSQTLSESPISSVLIKGAFEI